MKNRPSDAKDVPPIRTAKFIPRSPVGSDPEHSTLHLAAFLRTTGPNEITVAERNDPKRSTAGSIRSTGESSTVGLLRYQRYPPSPSTSTAYGTPPDEDYDDYELSMYPGARRKQKSAPQEESLLDFLRSTGPPEFTLPPSPTTPRDVRDKFTAVNKQQSRSNVRTPEPGQVRAIDIFEATGNTSRTVPPRVMSPTPSSGNLGPLLQSNDPYKQALTVDLPSPSLTREEGLFDEKRKPVLQPQSSLTHSSSIQQIRKLNGVEPRDPTMPHASTTDSLADFLRNTGPKDFGTRSSPKQVKKSKSAFLKKLLGGDSSKGLKAQGNENTSGRYTPIIIPVVESNYT